MTLQALRSTDILGKAGMIAKKFPAIVKGAKYLAKKDKSECLSIGTYLEHNAEVYPDHMALLYEDQRITHQEFNSWVNRYTHYLQKQGLRKGDSAAVFMENRPEVLVCVAALAKIGAVAALINTSQRQSVLVHSFKLCNPKAYIIGEELMEPFEEVKAELPTGGLLFFQEDGSDANAPEGYQSISEGAKLESSANPSSTLSVTLGDPCFYVYTSGTTGLPKASIMTHFRWVKAAAAFGMLGLNMKPSDTLYVALPFYHNNALTVSWGSAAAGGSAIAMRRKFSASRFWDDTRKFNATAFCYIGELCRYLMNQPPSANDKDNPVYKIVGNGLRADIWKEFKERFDIKEVYEFYGASEANMGFVNLLNFDCTVGLCPAKYTLVKYDTENDQLVKNSEGFLVEAEAGEAGLLIAEVNEKYAFDGYTDKDASEKKLLRDVFEKGDVWFNSGDLLRNLGFRHAQFVDRLGDTFRWKGENVSTTEVEAVLNQFESVEESTVYGVEIPGCDGKAGMGSVVGNVAVEDFDFQALTQLLKEELPAYAIPQFLRYQKQLEITGTFKHRKVELKKQAFDPAQVEDPLYVLLPKSDCYVPVTSEMFADIQAGKYQF